MKRYLIYLFLLFSCFAFSQEAIQAEKETIALLPLGDNPGDMAYHATEEAFYSQGSPFIDSIGRIIFYATLNGKNFIILHDGTKTVSPYRGNLSDYREMRSRNYNSQEGILYDLEPLAYNETHFFEYNYRSKISSLTGGSYNTYPTPWGALLYSEQQKAGIGIIFDVKNPGEDFAVVDQRHLKAWLSTQPGGFSIGEDGLLYRNGMLYSAANVPKWGNLKFSYLGRLASGHLVWKGGGRYGSETVFIVTSPDGRQEAIIKLPWNDDVQNNYYQFNYGLGPWGELYCLLPPQFIVTRSVKNAEGGFDPVHEPDPKGTAELVIIRNHLKVFGRLNDSNVRLRKDPSTSADVLGTYPAKTGFRIIEKGTKQETIGGKSDYWYHVRLLDGKEGWFFGSLRRESL